MTMYFTDEDNRIKNGGLPNGKGMTVYEYVDKIWLPAAGCLTDMASALS